MMPPEYATASVRSADGTTIGYRTLGHGPGLVLVHGGMMAAQNFMSLARGLADAFTVHVPDRRGRGRSGSFGDAYGLRSEVRDLDALLSATGSHYVFGLSSGAIIALQAALELPAVHKAAFYEPPLSFHDSSTVAWVPRYDREIAQGKLASAFVTVVKGTGDSALFRRVPLFLVVPLLALALEADARQAKNGDVALKDLVPTMHYDARLVVEAQGAHERFRDIQAEVLLLGGSRSAAYLRTALDRLSAVLPRARRVELSGIGHLAADNHGKPAEVATELRRFFASPVPDVAAL
jgi:pimeloyl-ACP methyl ester carboxylesterase